MLETIKALIKSKDICVLSTVSDGEPHSSLMSYVTDDECREFYMITLPATKKYRNLENNSTASCSSTPGEMTWIGNGRTSGRSP